MNDNYKNYIKDWQKNKISKKINRKIHLHRYFVLSFLFLVSAITKNKKILISTLLLIILLYLYEIIVNKVVIGVRIHHCFVIIANIILIRSLLSKDDERVRPISIYYLSIMTIDSISTYKMEYKNNTYYRKNILTYLKNCCFAILKLVIPIYIVLTNKSILETQIKVICALHLLLIETPYCILFAMNTLNEQKKLKFSPQPIKKF